MNTTKWYALILGIIMLFFSLLLLVRFLRYLSRILIVFFLMHIKYARLCRFFQNIIKTRFEAIFLLLFLLGNIMCLILYAETIQDIFNRLGSLSLINMVPLFLGGRINIITNLSSLNYRSYAHIHQWIGRIAAIEAIAHSVHSIITRSNSLSRYYVSGLTVSS
jgi:hypothetical protein